MPAFRREISLYQHQNQLLPDAIHIPIPIPADSPEEGPLECPFPEHELQSPLTPVPVSRRSHTVDIYL
jgi:hypothetical protein